MEYVPCVIKHNSCLICFWGLYGQYNCQLMTTEAKRWIYLVSNIGPTSRLWAELRCSSVGLQRRANELSDIVTTLGQHTIALAHCWRNLGYTLIPTLDQRRPYEKNYVAPMLVFNVVPMTQLMLDQHVLVWWV